MDAKPIKSLEIHHIMIQFLIIDISENVTELLFITSERLCKIYIIAEPHLNTMLLTREKCEQFLLIFVECNYSNLINLIKSTAESIHCTTQLKC